MTARASISIQGSRYNVVVFMIPSEAAAMPFRGRRRHPEKCNRELAESMNEASTDTRFDRGNQGCHGVGFRSTALKTLLSNYRVGWMFENRRR